MAEQTYNSDQTMSAAEEEALVASGEDLLVDDLPEGLIDHLADSAELPVAKKPCFDAGASHSPSSPSTNITASPESAQAHQTRLPVASAAAASSVQPSGPPPSQTATANAPSAPAGRAAAYASVASGSNPSLGLPASPFASPLPGTPPRNLRRARLTAVSPLLLPQRRRVVVSLLLPEAELEAHRTAIFAGINAMLCGFMFEAGTIPPFEQTVSDPLRMARRVYGRLQFSWPSQADATAFRRLFPLSLKLPNARPVLLKEFVDRFEEFTAAKAAGTPTLSIRNVPMEYAPEDIRAFLLNSTKPDGAHWLADLTNFHRASDPYEGTYFTHLAGLPVATPDDPHFDLIPSEILLEANKPPMLLNFSCHVCALCSNNHRASDHAAFAARRRQRLTNRNTISIAQLQLANGNPPHRNSPSLPPANYPPFRPLHLPPCSPPRQGPGYHPVSPLPPYYPSPCPNRLLPSAPASSLPLARLSPTPVPSPRLSPLPAPPSPRSHVSLTDFPLSNLSLTTPPCPKPPSPPAPLHLDFCPPPCHLRPPLLPMNAPYLTGNILGNHAAPTAFRNDPGLLFIGLDDQVETWTCALCDFTCGAALDSAMDHIQSDEHTTRVKATVHRPAAKEAFGPWRALTMQQKPQIAAFLRG
ncbi:unnamed protein product [Closterium sp. Yama58-4]|nr:unnamed protein product [Closterium sp. Yama58-4]